MPVADQSPLVQLTEPESLVSLLEPSELEVAYEMEDDFGFSRIRPWIVLLNVHLADPDNKPGYIALPTPSDRIATGQYTWNLSELQLLPLDAVRYWIEVTDNDAYSGFKTTRSAEQRVVVQSITEKSAGSGRTGKRSCRPAFAIFSRLTRKIAGNLKTSVSRFCGIRAINGDQQQAAERIRESREELSRQLEEIIRSSLSSLREDLADDNQLSQETKALYEDFYSDLIEENCTIQPLLEAMQKLQERTARHEHGPGT